MTERKMSAKGFLHKASGKAAVSAIAFIQAHREWLESGDVANVTTPILVKLDAGELLPTPALDEIKKAVLDHMLTSEIKKGEAAMERAANAPEPTPKNWTCTLYAKDGKVCMNGDKAIVAGFELNQDASNWMDRQLFNGPPDCFGVIQHKSMTNKAGDLIAFTVIRGDAIARILKKGKAPVMKSHSKTTSALGFGVKCKNDHCSFSRG